MQIYSSNRLISTTNIAGIIFHDKKNISCDYIKIGKQKLKSPFMQKPLCCKPSSKGNNTLPLLGTAKYSLYNIRWGYIIIFHLHLVCLNDKKLCYLQFLLIQSEMNVCLHYSGRMRELFSVPTVKICHNTYIWYLSNTSSVEDRYMSF